MSVLEARVLGPFVVLRAGQPLPLGRSKLRDLLVLLVAHSPDVVSADSIVDGPWQGFGSAVGPQSCAEAHLRVAPSAGPVALFSHPKDFTPVCTTELGEVARIKSEFDERNVKVIGLSVDPLDSHHRWAADIAETQGHAPNFPMIADPDRVVSDLYGMIHPNASDTTTVRSVFVIGPDRKVKLMITYPQSTGRNFSEVLRVIDSLQLTANHKVSTPVNWNQGDDVIIPAVTDDEARVRFPDGWKTVKPYLHIVPQPK